MDSASLRRGKRRSKSGSPGAIGRRFSVRPRQCSHVSDSASRSVASARCADRVSDLGGGLRGLAVRHLSEVDLGLCAARIGLPPPREQEICDCRSNAECDENHEELLHENLHDWWALSLTDERRKIDSGLEYQPMCLGASASGSAGHSCFWRAAGQEGYGPWSVLSRWKLSDDTARVRHEREVDRLSAELADRFHVAREIIEDGVRAEFGRWSTVPVQDFVPIFVERSVRGKLRPRDRANHAYSLASDVVPRA
jgi:hypothetical protein